jgi:hypothetical protein
LVIISHTLHTKLDFEQKDLLGPITQTDIAIALFSLGMTSAMVPPPRVSGAAPTQPARNRKTISMFKLWLTAQQMVQMKKRMLQE